MYTVYPSKMVVFQRIQRCLILRQTHHLSTYWWLNKMDQDMKWGSQTVQMEGPTYLDP
jgi:uncharacterized protein involved in tolerance to divalent cations